MKLRYMVEHDIFPPWSVSLQEGIVQEQKDEATLRFLTWNPTTVLIGSDSPWKIANVEEIEKDGYGLVRRHTGGTGIIASPYHEVNLGLFIPLSYFGEPFKPKTIYCNLSAWISEALDSIGIKTEREASNTKWDTTFNCFGSLGRCELTAKERKIIGGSVTWNFHTYLYEVQMSIDGWNFEQIKKYSAHPIEPKDKPISLNEAAGREVDRHEVYDAILKVLSTKFEIYEGRYRDAEIEIAYEYMKRKRVEEREQFWRT